MSIMNLSFFGDLVSACDWPVEYTDRLKEIRRIHARKEQDKTISKEERKEALRMVKAASILDDYIWAKGRFVKHCRDSDFPIELFQEMRIILFRIQFPEDSLKVG